MVKTLRNLVVASTAVALTGCATMEQQEQLGGTITGCILGGVVGALVSGPRGAAIGCAAAGALGWVLVANYQATHARSAQVDQKTYRRKDPDFYALAKTSPSAAVKIRKASVSPAKVKPGEEVSINTDFSLAVPQNMGTVPVEYSLILTKDGKTLTSKKMAPEDRDAGGWSYDFPIPIPQGAEPGVYVVKQKVSAGSSSYDERETKFTVTG